ncbi:MAG: hypothetical protein M1831_003719 [Alyxoria varia]|nr:MAG: hypothetical protein M1831_003719 [Alyxoria varia]
MENSRSRSPQLSPRPTPIPYTVFTHRQKRLITVVLTLTMLASPLTATIYLPLLPLLASDFDVSLQAMNLTITLYIVFQALSPLFFATASDHFGRRPILLATYVLYTVASLGLALNKHSYAALLVLRALQSLGASAVLAVAFGVVADVCPPAERGSTLGPTQSVANLAVCLGPVIGGFVAERSQGFVWVFWTLVIFGGVVWSVIVVALPETARNVVGNGSQPATRWGTPLWHILEHRMSPKNSKSSRQDCANSGHDTPATQQVNEVSSDQTNADRSSNNFRAKLRKSNPLGAIRIIFWRDTSLVLWMAASPYAVWYCVQASIPNIYKDIYGFNELQIGLAYLTGGAAVIVGGYLNGKLMDWNYRVTAKQAGRTIDKVAGDDLIDFPIEKARGRGSYWVLAVYICGLSGYGWSVEKHAHESVPLILQFVLGLLCTSFQQTYNALLVDVFPASPSTAAACSNITRCALSAAAVAVLQPIVGAIDRGWFFVGLAISSGGVGVISCWTIQAYGMQWRRLRLSDAKRKATTRKDSEKGNVSTT